MHGNQVATPLHELYCTLQESKQAFKVSRTAYGSGHGSLAAYHWQVVVANRQEWVQLSRADVTGNIGFDEAHPIPLVRGQ
jgi:hypothetical protein